MPREEAPFGQPHETVRRIENETLFLQDGPIDLRLGSGPDAQDLRIVNPLRDIGPESGRIVNVHIGCFIIDPQTLAPHRGYKALREGETVILGRRDPGRFSFSRRVSRNHVRIDRERDNAIGDIIHITDLGSTNGTYIVSPDQGETEVTQPDARTTDADAAPPTNTRIGERPTNFQMAGKSLPRNESGTNEDAYFIDQQNGAVAVFDGMGGHAGSEEASALAAQEVQRHLSKIPTNTPRSLAEHAIQEALENAHHSINEHNARLHRGSSQPGTTAIVAKIFETESGSPYAVIGSAGDSRAYLLRSGRIEQVTLDHAFLGVPPGRRREIQDTLSQVVRLSELSDTERGLFLNRAIIDSCLGAGPKNPSPTITLTTFELQAGDQILLTSDGVHDNLTDTEIEETVSPAGGDPEAIVDALVDAAKARSQDKSHIRSKADDTTAVVLSCQA